jgi:hypothetical protein
MKAWGSALAFGLLVSVAVPSGVAVAADPTEQLLLEQANYWRARHRPDLAAETLGKLLSINPSQPDALYQQGRLLLEQGNRGEAERYFDRLRQLASGDARAAALVGALPQAAAAPQAATVAVAAPKPAPAVSKPVPAPGPEFAVASADSDDLLPALPTARVSVAPVQPVAAAAPVEQVASLPPQTVSDGSVQIQAVPAAASPGGAADLGPTGKPVQMAQVELMPPPPVGGYQQPVAPAPYSPSDTLETDITRSLAVIEAQSNPTLIAGLAYRGQSGDDGLNRLNEVGLPIEGSFSPWYTGTARLSILPVWINADGSVASNELGLFGANPILAAHGVALAPSGNESYAGVGILGGYAYGDFTGQIGTSPLGFPVTNLIGNAAYAPKFLDDTLTVRIEGLRQPVTDSVLAYAGTHASLAAANAFAPGAFGTNSTWGGVVKSGGRITAFYDDQMYGAYGGAGYAELTGENVADNSVIDALAGAYFRPWKTDNWAIRTGVSVYYANFDKNLSGFTFGQGGYFSPQNYIALTFPVEYTGHDGPWSWLASAALGVQHYNADSSPIFPNNPAAQLALESTPGGLSFLGGATHTGPAFNLRGQIEYAIDNTLSIGAAASFDNGNSYDQGIAKIYLRKTFDWFAPVAIKSDPQSIVGRDQPMSRL